MNCWMHDLENEKQILLQNKGSDLLEASGLEYVSLWNFEFSGMMIIKILPYCMHPWTFFVSSY